MTTEPGPVARALLRITGHGDDDRTGTDHDGAGHDGTTDRGVAGHLCRACVAGSSVDGAAVSVLTASVYRKTLYATDPTAAMLEDLQFTLGEGVCMEAAASGRPVSVSDLTDHALTTRWPVFATAVVEQTDACALFALPLQLGTINLGVLDLYRTRPGPLTGSELRDVLAAVDATTMLLLETQIRAEADDLQERRPWSEGSTNPEQWEDGLFDDRAEVHQATGMIMIQLGVPAQDAFVRLRAYAFAHRRPLGAVARDVVAGYPVFTEGE